MRVNGKICFSEDDGKSWNPVHAESPVSMNFWGYTEMMMEKLIEKFPIFLKGALKDNPIKGEYLLPTITDEMIKNGEAAVKVLNSTDQWYGVTYKEDKAGVVSALQSMKDKGLYPDKLWK